MEHQVMTPEQAKQNDYELVHEQVERARKENSIGAQITAANIRKWYEDKYKERWMEKLDDRRKNSLRSR